jgi:hypothetical protein
LILHFIVTSKLIIIKDTMLSWTFSKFTLEFSQVSWRNFDIFLRMFCSAPDSIVGTRGQTHTASPKRIYVNKIIRNDEMFDNSWKLAIYIWTLRILWIWVQLFAQQSILEWIKSSAVSMTGSHPSINKSIHPTMKATPRQW